MRLKKFYLCMLFSSRIIKKIYFCKWWRLCVCFLGRAYTLNLKWVFSVLTYLLKLLFISSRFWFNDTWMTQRNRWHHILVMWVKEKVWADIDVIWELKQTLMLLVLFAYTSINVSVKPFTLRIKLWRDLMKWILSYCSLTPFVCFGKRSCKKSHKCFRILNRNEVF